MSATTLAHFLWHIFHDIDIEMDVMEIIKKLRKPTESKEEFSLSATIAVSTLLLAFIGSSFYILLTSYFELI
jgi:hypothetical protein